MCFDWLSNDTNTRGGYAVKSKSHVSQKTTPVKQPNLHLTSWNSQTLGMKIMNQGIMERKLLSVAFGLAGEAISSGCITRQYELLIVIKVGSYTSGPQRGRPQLGLQWSGRFRQYRPQSSGQFVHSSGCQTD